MTRLVVDASVAVKWFVPEPLAAEARRVLAAEYALLAPDLLWAELGNTVWKKQRRRELDPRTARRLLRDFARMPIEFHPIARWTAAALDLGMRHGITVYDALYVAVAAGQGCRVLTADRRLHDTCQEVGLRHLVAWVEELE